MTKNNLYKGLACLLLALPLGGIGSGLLTSCSDKWDDHYAESDQVSGGSLWQALQSDPNLSNFTEVVKTCGYDVQLSGSQTYTVFAPTNDKFSAEEAKSLETKYAEQKKAGIKDADNTTIRQFIQNHIALYRHSVSSLTNDSIVMLNGKYKVLNQKSLGSTDILSSNKSYANGELFTVGGTLDYFPNIYEYLKQDNELDSIYNFLSAYDDYEFQPDQSVAGSINENGETEYLDSVSTLSNKMLSVLGYINREDSVYWMVAPTNAEWSKLYNEYYPYFDYESSLSKYDSLQQSMAREAIIIGSFFNKNTNSDVALQDSAVSTQAITGSRLVSYIMGDDHQYIYYKPLASGGIFDGTTQVECSNGKIFKAADYRIDKYNTFCQDIKIEAENTNYQDTLVMCESPLTVQTVTSDNPFYDKISSNSYVDVVPKNTSSDADKWPQPQIRFSVPNTLSHMPYDVYIVMAPAEAGNVNASEEDKLPNRFSGYIYFYNKDGKLQQKRISAKETTPGIVDSILIAEDIEFPTSGYNMTNEVVKIQLISQVSRNQTSKYSNTLHIDCIILKPKK